MMNGVKWDRKWEDLSADEKIEEIHSVLLATVEAVLMMETQLSGTISAGRNVVEAAMIMNKMASKSDERIKSLERRVDALTAGGSMSTIWSKN